MDSPGRNVDFDCKVQYLCHLVDTSYNGQHYYTVPQYEKLPLIMEVWHPHVENERWFYCVVQLHCHVQSTVSPNFSKGQGLSCTLHRFTRSLHIFQVCVRLVLDRSLAARWFERNNILEIRGGIICCNMGLSQMVTGDTRPNKKMQFTRLHLHETLVWVHWLTIFLESLS